MNIPGSIEAELKAAREEGRREGLCQATWVVGAELEELERYATEQEALDGSPSYGVLGTCAAFNRVLDALEAAK